MYGFAADLLQSCNENTDFLTIKKNFELADRYYKEARAKANHLSLWHAAKVEGKSRSEWSSRQVEQEALVRSFDGMVSTTMNHLLMAYGVWLAKSQFNRPAKVDEDDVGAP
jgi:hypothetical protein